MSNTPPVVVVTNPPSGAVFACSSIVVLQATAGDSDGTVTQVQFYSTETYIPKTNLLGFVSTPPFTLKLTNAFCGSGNYFYDLTAVAVDNQAARSTSAPVRIYFPQGPYPPHVAITQPKDGDVFSGSETVDIAASVVTYYGSERPVDFLADGQLLASVPPPYKFSVTNLPPGTRVLTARYVDENLNVGVSPSVTITIEAFSLLTPQVSKQGQFGFSIQGLVTGNYFQVETSSNLLNWFLLSSNIATSNSFEFIDAAPANLSWRFYRTLQKSQ